MWFAVLVSLPLACAEPPPPPAPPAPAPAPAAAPGRLFAVGDLHADLDNAVAALGLAGLVDGAGHWTGGTATLVQTGDVTDRGPDSKAVMSWLRTLDAEATAAGGRVISLLGNHEAMNVRGDWRYVHPDDLAAYGGADARRGAFSASGEDGRWLRTLNVAAQVGDTVFVHGGLHPDHLAGGLDALSERVRRALDAPGNEPVLVAENSPMWYRGYVTEPEETVCPLLRRALGALGARRMVVGHTVRTDGHIQPRCQGALVVIDIGIADPYGGHLGVLELRQGSDAWALYPTGPLDLPDP